MLIVLKVGGDLLLDGLSRRLIDELETLNREHKIVLVHGGGDIVTEISTKLGHPPKFVLSPRGFKSRYTDKEASEIYTMVMAGKINKEIVSALQKYGIPAVGLSGLDGGLIRAKRKAKLITVDERGRRMLIEGGYTGQIKDVNVAFLRLLIENGYVPVLSSVALGEDAEPLNVDGDRVGASVASAIKADVLILLTDVEGVRLNGTSVDKMHVSEAKEVVDQMGPGMITKVHAAIEAAEGGVSEVVIASGLKDDALSSALRHGNGTVIKK